MAFFRGGFDDAFFGDVHRMMRNHMRDMDSMFDIDTGDRTADGRRHQSAREQMIDDGGEYGRRGRRSMAERGAMVPRDDPISSLMEPFGFGFGQGLFGGLMSQMEHMQSAALNDPNSHIYTQSTVVTMAPGDDGRMKYYESSDSVRKAGSVKETRRSVRDSGSGLEKMEIGHHIGNRGHVIEKRRDRTTGGQIVEKQDFIGLKHDEAEQFDREWSHATRPTLTGDHSLVDDASTGQPQLAIDASKRRRSRSVPRQHQHEEGPIIQEITDESESDRRHRGGGSGSGGFLSRVKSFFHT